MLLGLIGFEVIVGLCSYAYFWYEISASPNELVTVSLVGLGFYSDATALPFIVVMLVVGACVFWAVWLLVYCVVIAGSLSL
jgi:hypothetical protein